MQADERKVFEHIESATVLKPGDRVLLVLDGYPSLQQMEETRELLRERFPWAEFTMASGVEAVIVKPAVVEENTDD